MIMKKKIFFYLLFFYLIANCCNAQNSVTQIDTLLSGTWKGTSLCQVKNSPCHDEIVVYHVSKNKGADTFYITANKIVNGAEEEMGILPFTYNEKTNQLISTSYGTWTFTVEAGKLEGTLISRGSLYRIINLTKQY